MNIDFTPLLTELKSAFEAEDYALATSLLEPHRANPPEEPVILWYIVALMEIEEKEKVDILNIVNNALELAPEWGMLIDKKFNLLIALENVEEAVDVGEKLVTIYPNAYQLRFQLADMCRSIHHFARAGRHQTEGHYLSALVFSHNEQPEKALTEYETCLNLEPTHLNAKLNIIECLFTLGKQDEAIERLDREMQYNDLFMDASRIYTKIARASQNWELLYNISNAMLEKYPDNVFALSEKITAAENGLSAYQAMTIIAEESFKNPTNIHLYLKRIQYSQMLVNDIHFLNLSHSSEDFWRLMQALSDCGMYEMALTKISSRNERASELAYLEEYCRRMIKLGNRKFVNDIMQVVTTEEWGTAARYSIDAQSQQGVLHYPYKIRDHLNGLPEHISQDLEVQYTIIECVLLFEMGVPSKIISNKESPQEDLKVVDAYIAENPENSTAIGLRGVLKIREGFLLNSGPAYDQAVIDLERARTMGFDRPFSAYWLSYGLHTQGEYESSAETYDNLFVKRISPETDFSVYDFLRTATQEHLDKMENVTEE